MAQERVTEKAGAPATFNALTARVLRDPAHAKRFILEDGAGRMAMSGKSNRWSRARPRQWQSAQRAQAALDAMVAAVKAGRAEQAKAAVASA